jgi:hypothetical protein
MLQPRGDRCLEIDPETVSGAVGAAEAAFAPAQAAPEAERPLHRLHGLAQTDLAERVCQAHSPTPPARGLHQARARQRPDDLGPVGAGNRGPRGNLPDRCVGVPRQIHQRPYRMVLRLPGSEAIPESADVQAFRRSGPAKDEHEHEREQEASPP